MNQIDKLIDRANRLGYWFPVYLFVLCAVAVIGVCGIFGYFQEYAETKSKYLNLCVQSSKPQIECQMRWIEINR